MPKPDPRRLEWWCARGKSLSATVLLALFGGMSVAASLSPALQGELDRAVVAYESGRLEEAYRQFEALGRKGVPAAWFNMAAMHLQGEVPRPDKAAARAWMIQAASAGFVTAQFAMGQALETGVFGPRQLTEAHAWYERAALAGSVEAQVAVATGFYLGRGARKDAAEAAHWYREAAKRGDVGAQYLLASMYEQGDGLVRDLRLARYWYDVAARNGDESAPGKVREIDALGAADKAVPGTTARP
jgi:uncharacterized protein